MSSLTLSAPTNYLDAQSDFDGTLQTSNDAEHYFTCVSRLPWADKWLAKNQISFVSSRFSSFGIMLARCVRYVSARLAEGQENKHRDFLEDFLGVAGGRSAPNVPLVISWLMHNVSCHPLLTLNVSCLTRNLS